MSIASTPPLGVCLAGIKNLLLRPLFRAGNATPILKKDATVDDLHHSIFEEMLPLKEAYVNTNAVPDTHKSPATCFVSHAHKMRLVDLIRILENYEMKHPNTFFWLDSLCFNPDQCRLLTTEEWWDTFQETIAACPAMLVALSGDWIKHDHDGRVWVPHAPTRPWCVAEFFLARRAGRTPVIGMLPKTLEEIEEHLRDKEYGHNFLRHTLNAIDAKKVISHSSVPPTVPPPNDKYGWENKHLIEGKIKEHMEPILHAVDANNIIRQAILDMLHDTFSPQYQERPETAFALGKVFLEYEQRGSRAEDCFKAAHGTWLQRKDDFLVSVCLSELAQLCQSQSWFVEAEHHISECVRLRRQLLAADASRKDKVSVRLHHALELSGSILLDRKKVEESRAAFEESLKIKGSSYACRFKFAEWWADERNPSRNITTARDVAQRALEDLEAISDLVMPERDKVFDRQTIERFQAKLLITTDRPREAIDLLLRQLPTVTVQGDQSSQVADTCQLLCQAHFALNDENTARKYAERLYTIRSAQLNPQHLDLAIALEYRGLCHQHSDPELARESFLRARDIMVYHGNTHEVQKIDKWLAALPPTAA